MSLGFSFQIIHSDTRTAARVGLIHTPHGDIQTPTFVPVGTQSTVKSLTPDELSDLGVKLFFVNTYHAYLRPGLEVIKKFGGLHKFMNWSRPLITDSGGFQVFSLARNKVITGHSREGGNPDIKTLDPLVKPEDDKSGVSNLVKITEDGVEFRSHWDGSKHLFTPESSMGWQWDLGADIHIAFDDCTAYPVTHETAKASMERTHRWAERSLAAHQKLAKNYELQTSNYQALYGVIQGSVYEDLRTESAKFTSGLDTDGIAIGGVAVGESKSEMKNVLDWVMPLLPSQKPRHLLGVGEIDDIFELVAGGVDTFDCVQPTRLARTGMLLINSPNKHQLDITKSVYSKDTSPIDPACTCYTCMYFSRAYLHHLFRVRELLGYRLATLHNLHFMQSLMQEVRSAITENRFLALQSQWVI